MISRRQFMSASAGLGLYTAFPGQAAKAQAYLPEPKFDDLSGFVARSGLRPTRHGGMRLAVDKSIEGIFVVHNYGHGGAGITLSWGCAAEVMKMLRQKPEFSGERELHVLGSGMIGLAVAMSVLREFPQKRIIIHTKDQIDRTTSFVAGGQFYASGERPGMAGPARDRIDGIINSSYQILKTFDQARYGVFDRVNYSMKSNLDDAPEGFGNFRKIAVKPFERIDRELWAFDTKLIQVPLMMQRLRQDLLQSGRVEFQARNFNSLEDVRRLRAKSLVNCLGLGSKGIFPDPSDMVGKKGTLAILKPDPRLNYMFSGERGGDRGDGDFYEYMFPRPDGLIIGGTGEYCFLDGRPNEELAKFLVYRMKTTFQGGNAEGDKPGDRTPYAFLTRREEEGIRKRSANSLCFVGNKRR
jgi:D-amino-acid oxidase